ncbi:T9SS type A sorting domain-containing protein, partial [Candidatus Symbiothrix dinenymphae]|uniref:T9SS type A sorting domain-containing protein n=1 Tax=Candidatus Symbiothrix dinenymphae TaxID=467085 RepID=UPI000A49F42B
LAPPAPPPPPPPPHPAATAATATVEPTHWKPVSVAQYSGNMSIIAEVRDNEELLTRAEVAVFAGEECRGVAKTNDKGMLFISVAGDADVPLTFRVFDATKGVEREVMQEERYQSDAILGAVKAPHVIALHSLSMGENIRIYPTKVKNSLSVVSANGKILRSISLYDTGGRLEQREEEVNAAYREVNVASLAPGVHLVTVETTDGERLMARVVKE